MDWEKVIKGLSIHKSYGNDCTGCPYQCDDREICVENLCNDALALLKEQEAQKFFVDESGKITPLPVVVRCKDCKYWKQYESYQIGECEIYKGYNRSSNWFCADGERREEDA